ncbi:hypothetical protein AX15_004253 [Amanita polypyramis BW_CC]|nr:hypothetical protein AX15_004253 [Amanita polypyramis BW_CC]
MSVFLPALRLRPRLAAVMDNLLAIGLGVLVRNVIHFVSRGDHKMTGTLVGMWEGVVLSHFLRKMRYSFDPLLAYAVRLFIDWFITENVTRLVLVVVWTGLGVILADIAPSLWVDVGLHRYWRRFRRDVYYMSRSMPKVDIFPRARTVRFSPSNTTAVLTDTDTTVSPSVASTSRLPATPQPPVPVRPISKRHVPGSFESDVDTNTEAGSVRSRQRELPTLSSYTRRRQTIFPAFTTVFRDDASEATSVGHDVDEGNISSPISEGQTEDLSAANPNEIPDELELEYVDTKPERAMEDGTPKQRNIGLPTPTDSTHPFDPMRHEEDHVRPPPPADILTIPDNCDDWEKIARDDAESAPPSLPEKNHKQPSAPSPSPFVPLNDQSKEDLALMAPLHQPSANETKQTQRNISSDNVEPTRDSTTSERPPAYQDVYDEQNFIGPLAEKLPVSGDGVDGKSQAPPEGAQSQAGADAQARSENGDGAEGKSESGDGAGDRFDIGAQAKSEDGDGVEDKSVASDLSEETFNSLEGLTCLQQMARLHQLIVKARKDYEGATQRHKSVRTSGNKGMVNHARVEMDAFERRLKKLTNKAEACYLTHNQPDRKFAEEVDLSKFKTESAWEGHIQTTLEQFLRPSVEMGSLRFLSLRSRAGKPQKDYITNLVNSLKLTSRAEPSNTRLIIVDK